MFDGGRAMNYDMTESTVDCPKCKRKMHVGISYEYFCRELEKNE